jgi:hypothetical protein
VPARSQARPAPRPKTPLRARRRSQARPAPRPKTPLRARRRSQARPAPLALGRRPAATRLGRRLEHSCLCPPTSQERARARVALALSLALSRARSTALPSTPAMAAAPAHVWLLHHLTPGRLELLRSWHKVEKGAAWVLSGLEKGAAGAGAAARAGCGRWVLQASSHWGGGCEGLARSARACGQGPCSLCCAAAGACGQGPCSLCCAAAGACGQGQPAGSWQKSAALP